MPGPYDDIVSLGRDCQAAYQLRRILGIDRANVFDWLVTRDPGLLTHIETGLHGFFAPESLITDAKGIVRDRVTATTFPHEFPSGADFATAHAKAAPRIAALVSRWQALVASDRSALFIRLHGWTGRPLHSAEALRDTLRLAAPRLRFRLLYLTTPDIHSPTPDTPDLIHRPLAQPDPPDWRGHDAAWQAILEEALLLPAPDPS